MKKKVASFILALVIIATVTGCGKNEVHVENQTRSVTTTPSEEPAKEAKQQEPQNSYTVDGITITVNGFDVKSSDDIAEEESTDSFTFSYDTEENTNRIEVEFTIKNDTDKAFGYIPSFEGKLEDGYELESFVDINDMDLHQVPSHSEKTDYAYFEIEDSINPGIINLTYNFMDYDKEYWDDFGKIMAGEMNEQEFLSKHGNYQEITLTAERN